MARSMMNFTELPLSFWRYALEKTTKLLNMAPFKKISQTPYEIWHNKPSFYKYLKVRDEILLEESSEVSRETSETTSTPIVPIYSVPVLRRSARVTQPPERYGFVGLTSQFDNDPKTYGEAMSEINSDKWLEAMKSEMDSMGSIQVWTLVEPPKGVKPIGCKWVYKHKFGADGEVTIFKVRLVAKVTLNDLGSTLRKPTRLWQ
ncbi:UNVERIFIED_CONTAM: hypothetical protein Sradi_3252200 [Sesamum radiatum]|uniref:Reverse transcriptase Ty1/copia-type domain-containing protein n=1 Tax=Sesamum radiatum TaxID=300843 RepID=A0AAW2QZL5_SESRA